MKQLTLVVLVGFILVPALSWWRQKFAPPPAQAVVGDVTIDQSTAGTFTARDMVAQKLTDSANTAYFLDPAATGTSLVMAGGATVAGTVESTTGGFKFPDATTQTTAASGSVQGYAESLTESSTNQSTVLTKVTLTVNPTVNVNQMLTFSFIYKGSYGYGMRIETRVDGVQKAYIQTDPGVQTFPYCGNGCWTPFSQTLGGVLTAGSHTFDIRFWSTDGNNTVAINQARIAFLGMK